MEFNYTINENNNKFELLPTGTYEVECLGASLGATKNGKTFLQVTLRVRDDLNGVSDNIMNQRFNNRRAFIKHYPSKKTHRFPEQLINSLGTAAGAENGFQLSSFEDFNNLISGKMMRVKIEERHTPMQNGGTWDENQVAPREYKKTHYPVKTSAQQAEDIFGSSNVTVADDDLPFSNPNNQPQQQNMGF